jgi:hypothetical protein
MSIKTILKSISDNGTLVAGIVTGITAVVGSVIAFETRYAQASDVQDIVQVYRGSQEQTQLFQLEYYSDRIKKLEDERRRSEVTYQQSGNSIAKGMFRTPSEISEDLADVKKRKEFLERQMVESQRALKK